MKKLSILLLSLLITNQSIKAQIVKGINIVGPFDSSLNTSTISEIKDINAEWISFLPEAQLNRSTLLIKNSTDNLGWTQSISAYQEFIQDCIAADIKVILKPHLVLQKTISSVDKLEEESSWRGDFKPKSDESWTIIESEYEQFILQWAELAQKENVSAFFIGTELKSFIKWRPQFWQNLIPKIKHIYKGPISYSANWDNYKEVRFWNQLNFIGINAYFPVNDNRVVNTKETESNWMKIVKELKKLQSKTNKKILFTEFGYRNIEYAGSEPWLHVSQTKDSAREDSNQYNLLKAYFESIWQEDFVIGGLLWNWNQVSLSKDNTDFSIQNKPAKQLVKDWFAKEIN